MRPYATANDEHVAADRWLPRRGRVAERSMALVTDGPLVSVSDGGAPHWVEVSEATLALAQVLHPEPFDAQRQATQARCMVSGWGEQSAIRAAMEFGERRWRALVSAEKALRYLVAPVEARGGPATKAQVDYINEMAEDRYLDDDLIGRIAEVRVLGMTRDDAATLIPLLKACPRNETYRGGDDDDALLDDCPDFPVGPDERF